MTRTSVARPATVLENVRELFRSPIEYPLFKDGPVPFQKTDFLCKNVASIAISDIGDGSDGTGIVTRDEADLRFYVYQLSEEGPSEESEQAEDTAAYRQWCLPAKELHGMWESLLFDSDVKKHLLQYAMSTIVFSDRMVDTKLIAWNRVVLLHGPPGTGKTSLCMALAQKLSIRLAERFSYGQIIEVNSHSLFSKWFSESGKLVARLFDRLRELMDDPQCLVFVLIDEVESLAAARKAALAGSEPSDSIRAVNALLTQLDQLKERKNVMILTTSNVTEAIDIAFVDRADLKLRIGPPSARARYQIIRSCLVELMRTGLISPSRNLHEDTRNVESPSTKDTDPPTDIYVCSRELLNFAVSCEGLSGRTLRKLPFLAHAFFVQAPSSTYEQYMWALNLALAKEKQGRLEVAHG